MVSSNFRSDDLKTLIIILSMIFTLNAYGSWTIIDDESFEGVFAPDGWLADVDTDKTTTWSKAGDWSARLQKNTDYMITPLIYNAETLTFWWRNGASTCSNTVAINIEYSTDSAPGGTWTAITGAPITRSCFCAFTQEELDLTDYGDVYVKFSRGDVKTYYIDVVNATASAATPVPPTPVNTPPPVPTPGIILTEIADSGTESYVELYNYNDFPINLGGYNFKLIIGDYHDSSDDYEFRDCDVIPANAHFLIGNQPTVDSVPVDAIANIEVTRDSARGNSYVRLLYPRDLSRMADVMGWSSQATAPAYYRTSFLATAPTVDQALLRETSWEGYLHWNSNRYDWDAGSNDPHNSGRESTHWRCFTMDKGSTIGSTSYYTWYDLSGFPSDIVDDWDHVWVRSWAVCTGDFTAYVRYGNTVQGQPYNYPAEYRKGWNTAPGGGPWTETILDGLEFGYPIASKVSDSAIQVYYSGSAAPTPSPAPSPTPTP